MTRLRVDEVHNFGGFFGGDTVTLTGTQDDGEVVTLTIDQAALGNISDRHTVAAGMLFALEFAGERVERATLLAAREHAILRGALGTPALPPTFTGVQITAWRCEQCGDWNAGNPEQGCANCTP